jgi:hypothetical protein
LKATRENEEIEYLNKNHIKEVKDEDIYNLQEQMKSVGRKTMDFGYTSRLLKQFCKSCIKSPKEKIMMKLYKRVNCYVSDKLDIVHYIKSLEHLDRVKLLLLNTEQKLAFDFIKRPNLADQGEIACFEIDFKKNRTNDATCVINYFVKKAQEGTLDDKDREIFPLLEPVLKNFMFNPKGDSNKATELIEINLDSDDAINNEANAEENKANTDMEPEIIEKLENTV